MNVESKFEGVTEGSASGKACVAKASELGVSWDNVANVHFPFIIWVCHEIVDVCKFSDD